ncbi:hypothetical protein EIP91_002987 [Steccherinum ochraceum]|uniref:histidinol-phosphate transaminase n=1 Tax=Steccherinum ochraceum TaxID=92696 RepID=A0A4R0RB78_9APHY|nr:hypothetical protein EIP91_002987 [Steccherinum ochraceum]
MDTNASYRLESGSRETFPAFPLHRRIDMNINGLPPKFIPTKPAHFDIERVIRPNILALQPYRCARDDYSEGILLDANENALGHSIPLGPNDPAAKLDLHRYPSPTFDDIKTQIAQMRSLPGTEYVFLGVGSDEIIDLLMRICVAPGKEKILTTPPTYGMYAVKKAIDADPLIKLVFLCSPGNPTGTRIPIPVIRELLEYQNFKGVVVVDEAYIDFAGENASAAALAVQYANLCVMQTVSKSFGLAGIRLGIAIAHPALIQVLTNTKAPYNISAPTASLALSALQPDAVTSMRQKVSQLVASRGALLKELAKLSALGLGPSIGGNDANFVVVPVLEKNGNGKPDNTRAHAIYKTLAEEEGVVVRYRGSHTIPPHLALMLKHKKAPTPQDLYRARKQREEDEKDAYLPPGLVNHGNTCFMNSTLQGLIATQSLHDLVISGHVSSQLHDVAGSSILSRRSPLLTNGHGVGGQYEHAWSEGMPLGDKWLDIMQRAWIVQDARKRQSMSPKDLLTTIGTKYDQYLDFQQQDAHEFLRHLLDAMRMEEADLIKKRQPPAPNGKRRKRDTQPPPEQPSPLAPDATPTPASLHLQHTEDAKLESFVDMLFGGRLASILVCEKCKKISVTYEDFNDLSLSIKPEDYVKERKRDRFKMIAKKLRFRPKELGLGPVPMQRASSVPASPVRRSMDVAPHDEEVPVNEGPRRGSFDHSRPERGSSEDEGRNGFEEDGDGDDEKEKEKEVKQTGESSKNSCSAEVVRVDTKESVHFDSAKVEAHREARKEEREHKDKEKEKDPWNKLGRRVSVAMKMGGKQASKRLSRSMDRHRNRDTESTKDEDSSKEYSRPSSRRGGAIDSGSEMGDMSDANRSRAVSPVRSPLTSPPMTAPINPFEMRRLSSDPLIEKRAKSPRPPKASREEAAYLRRILADVNPSVPSAFTLLHQALSNAGSGALGAQSPTAQSFLTKLGYLPGVEECLRLFTAVEVMDGENMVGCHRCWKIANGTYKPKHSANILHEDEEDGSDERGEEPPIQSQVFPEKAPSSSAESSPDLSKLSPASTPVILTKTNPSSLFLTDNTSSMSCPTTIESAASKVETSILLPAQPDTAYGGLPIPSISATAPDTPLTSPVSKSTPTLPSSRPESVAGQSAAASLLAPAVKRRSKAGPSKKTDESSDSSDDEFDSSASDASASALSDASSAASSVASPTVSPRTSLSKLRSDRPALPRSHSAESSLAMKSSIPRSQQVVPRRMYKRYLVATPPPILVVHLKRFQQTSKTPIMSFSAGFKKLDEFVAFPEYLDLSPYLTPRKEDFGLGKPGKDRSKRRAAKSKDEKCMYRLYAVVVHIGNMLGGHYISYTALPPAHTPRTTSAPSTPDLGEATPTPAAMLPHIAEQSSDSSKDTKAPPRQWAYISDTVVRLTTLEEVLKAKAYICMYERV